MKGFLAIRYVVDEPGSTLMVAPEFILIKDMDKMNKDAAKLGFDVKIKDHNHKNFMCCNTYQQSKPDDSNHMLELHYDVFTIPLEDLGVIFNED